MAGQYDGFYCDIADLDEESLLDEMKWARLRLERAENKVKIEQRHLRNLLREVTRRMEQQKGNETP